MSDFITRLLDEREGLRIRSARLGRFITSPAFQEVGPRQQYLLQRQHEVMTQYLDILSWRIDDLSATPPR